MCFRMPDVVIEGVYEWISLAQKRGILSLPT